MPSEFLIVAEKVFRFVRKPLRPTELVSIAVREGLFSDKRAGKTPAQTMKSKLSVHIRRFQTESTFIRTGPGRFYLRELIQEGDEVYEAPPLSKPKSLEEVLVFPGNILGNGPRFQGIKTKWKQLYRTLLKPSTCSYLDRMTAETDDTQKQVLTYVMVTRRGSVLAYKRGSFSRVEDFLRGSHCIGFGGHVTIEDRDLFSFEDMGVRQCAIRELMEELKLPARDQRRLQSGEGLSIIGALNDDSSTVGQRHFAFLFRYEVSNDPAWNKPPRGEKSITQLRWLSRVRGPVPIWDFEYWSQLCLRHYHAPLATSAPTYRINRRWKSTDKHVLCVVGMVGSGKSEATRVLCREFGYEEINSGRVLANLLHVPPVPKMARETFQTKAYDFISDEKGPCTLAKAIWQEIQSIGALRCLVDGIRQPSTLSELRNCAGQTPIKVIFVHATPDICYKFYKERESDDISIFKFLNIQNAPVERQVREMIGLSDAVLYNWTGRHEYRSAVGNVMREFGIRRKYR